MRPILQLYGRHPGADIYIVGTGASLRVFPLELLRDKITIGLNQSWKIVPTRYSITMMPAFNIPEFMPGEMPRKDLTWITKRSKMREQCTPEQLAYAEPIFYRYENKGSVSFTGLDVISESGRVLDWVRQPHPQMLYLGRRSPRAR